eukprot:g1947.t1
MKKSFFKFAPLAVAGGCTAFFFNSLSEDVQRKRILTPVLAKSSSNKKEDILPNDISTPKDVIIIGAGFAGATVARELKTAGMSCKILEARGRVGGRTFTTEWLGEVVELGGHYVHWSQPHLWAEMTRYNAEIEEITGLSSDDYIFKLDVGGTMRDCDPSEFEKVLASAIERFAAIAPSSTVLQRPYDPLWEPQLPALQELDALSMQDRLDAMEMTEEERAVVTGWWEGCACTTADRAGLVPILKWFVCPGRDVSAMFDSTSRYKLKEGTRGLIGKILKDSEAKVHLWSPVKSIQYRKENVIVELQNGEKHYGKAVVVTVPLNVLSEIEFNPPLSTLRQQAAIEKQATTGFQLMIYVKPNDDEEENSSVPDFVAISDTKTGIQWLSTEWCVDSNGKRKSNFAKREKGDGAVMVSYGPNAKAFNIHDPKIVEKEVQRLMGDKVKVMDSFGWNWVNDDFAKGTWTIMRPGQLTRFHQALNEPEWKGNNDTLEPPRLYFAGDYLAGGWNGFIDGAIESGLTTSRRLIKEFRNEK